MSAATIVGRDPLAERLAGLYRASGGAGATLIGPAGIGKTALARCVADQLATEFDAAWITGATAAADIPLAAFAAFLPPSGTPSELSSLVHIRDAVMTTSHERRRLLVVDDAHALDETSAALVHQLTMYGVRVLMTQRAGAVAPDAVTRLWRDRTLERIDVGPLDAVGIEWLAADLLHGAVDPSSAHEVWRRTSGNPLFARELVLASHAAGEWSVAPTGWRWNVGDADSPRLADLLRDRLSLLDATQLEALEHLAFGEPMGIGEFSAICDDVVLEALEHEGLITADADRRRITIRFTHPLHADVVRRTVSPLRARGIRTRVVERLRATGARRREDTMRLATLALEAGAELDRDHLLDAARAASSAGDRATATRLAQEAFERHPDFESGLVLADALDEEGRLDDVRRHWDDWAGMATDDDQRAIVAMHAASTLYHRAGDDAGAFAALDRVREQLGDGPRRDESAALAATLHAMSGRTAIARSLAEPLLDVADGRVRAQAALVMVHVLSAGGDTAGALALARSAPTAPTASIASAAAFEVGETAVLLAAGRFEESLRSADDAFEAARRSGHTLAEGLSQLSRAEALLAVGRFVDAAHAARHAESVFARIHHRGFRRWAVIQRIHVATVAGDAGAAALATADLAALGPHPAALYEYVRVTAEVAERYDDDPVRTRRDAIALASGFARQGDLHAAIRIVYELVRLGDPSAASDLAGWARRSDSPLHAAMAAHAGALADDDAEALGAVAEALAELGAIVDAARAAEQASDVADRAGDERRTRRWSLAATGWKERCQPIAPASPTSADDPCPALERSAPRVAAEPLPALTRREREIALLAAQGLAARAIGDRLFLSPRTVENHLAKAYGKLGVGSRAELAHVLASA
jgi:DNA-binding CsgD family transcriptional regulator